MAVTPSGSIGALSATPSKMLFDLQLCQKIYGKTAINAGTYALRITYSNRFKKDILRSWMYHRFEGVRIHGNTAKDTLGCILVGMNVGANRISNCAPAAKLVMDFLEQAERNRVSSTIEIINPKVAQ